MKTMGIRGKINTIWWNSKINLQKLANICGYKLSTNLQNLTQKDFTEVKIFQKVLGGILFSETPCMPKLLYCKVRVMDVAQRLCSDSGHAIMALCKLHYLLFNNVPVPGVRSFLCLELQIFLSNLWYYHMMYVYLSNRLQQLHVW